MLLDTRDPDRWFALPGWSLSVSPIGVKGTTEGQVEEHSILQGLSESRTRNARLDQTPTDGGQRSGAVEGSTLSVQFAGGVTSGELPESQFCGILQKLRFH
jgi:hypothetical protein